MSECNTCGTYVDYEHNQYCYNCGIHGNDIFEKQSFYNNINKKENIEKEFEEFGVPESIRATAISYYKKITNGDILKDSNRRGLIWMCCYEAFKHNGIAKDPILLGIKFNLDRKHMNKGLRKFWERICLKGYKEDFPKIQLSTKDLLPEFMDLFDVDEEDIDDLIEITDSIKNNLEDIDKYQPRSIVIAAIFWYINQQSTNNKLLVTDVCKDYHIPHTTLTKLLNVINSIC